MTKEKNYLAVQPVEDLQILKDSNVPFGGFVKNFFNLQRRLKMERRFPGRFMELGIRGINRVDLMCDQKVSFTLDIFIVSFLHEDLATQDKWKISGILLVQYKYKGERGYQRAIISWPLIHSKIALIPKLSIFNLRVQPATLAMSEVKHFRDNYLLKPEKRPLELSLQLVLSDPKRRICLISWATQLIPEIII